MQAFEDKVGEGWKYGQLELKEAALQSKEYILTAAPDYFDLLEKESKCKKKFETVE